MYVLEELLMPKCPMLSSGLVPKLKQNFNKSHIEKINGMESKEPGNYIRNVYLRGENLNISFEIPFIIKYKGTERLSLDCTG